MKKICKVDGCGKKHRAKGFCMTHYLRFRKHESTDLPKRNRHCSVNGCDRKHYGKGYCEKHYANFHKTGNPIAIRLGWDYNHPDKCSVEGCGRPYLSKGFCNTHYTAARRKGELTTEQCKVEGCLTNQYIKGYCRVHYDLIKRHGTPKYFSDIIADDLKGHKCDVKNCDSPAFRHTKNNYYCKFHYSRSQQKNTKRKIDDPRGNKGELNHMWKGGIFEYPNHYVMRKLRIELIKKYGEACQVCGKKGKVHIHHKDKSKDKHTEDNFILACPKCHLGVLHKGMSHKSKYTKEYGMSQHDIAFKLSVAPATIIKWHKEGVLHDYLLNGIPTKEPCNNARYYKKGNMISRLYGAGCSELSKMLNIKKHEVYIYHHKGQLSNMIKTGVKPTCDPCVYDAEYF